MGFRYLDKHVIDYFNYTAVPDAFFDLEHHPEFKNLSLEAILLYSKMLRRAMMSRQHDWIDENGHVYIIYSRNEICKDLRCASEKATKIIKELQTPVHENDEHGLIIKKRMGLQMPDRIYVLDFSQYDTPTETTKQPSNQNNKSTNEQEPKTEQSTDNPDKQEVSPDVRKSNFKKSDNRISGSSETEPLEVRKSNLSNQDKNINTGVTNTVLGDISDDLYISQSVSQSEEKMTDRQTDRQSSNKTAAEREELVKKIRKNISYDFVEEKLFGETDPDDSGFNFAGIGVSEWDLFQSIFEIMCDTVRSKSDIVYIGRSPMPYEQVMDKLLQVRHEHMVFIIKKFTEESQKRVIQNRRAYLMRCIYNAPADMVIGSY